MTRKLLLTEVILILVAVAATAVLYPHLPSTVATHWNANLQPNGYSPKWELFLLGPGLMVAVALLATLAPWLSPKKFEVDSFRATYDEVMFFVFCLMGFICATVLLSASGRPINAGRSIEAGACILFVLLGNVMGKIRRNFFLGIRTPWSLASERVWNATHRFGAKTFVVGGLLGLLTVLFGWHSWTLGILLAGALSPAVYSFILYKRFERAGEL